MLKTHNDRNTFKLRPKICQNHKNTFKKKPTYIILLYSTGTVGRANA